MKKLAFVAVMVAGVGLAPRAEAQEWRGFANAGVMSDVNEQRFPSFAGGVLFDLPTSWVSAGAQGEVFVSWPYAAGRGAVFGQANVVRRGAVRPFLLAGYGWGESAGMMFGGGVEVRVPNRRIGLRATVEDYVTQVAGFDCGYLGYSQSYCDQSLRGGRAYAVHQLAVRVGIVF